MGLNIFEIVSRLLRIFDVCAFGSLGAKDAYFGLWGSGMGYDKAHWENGTKAQGRAWVFGKRNFGVPSLPSLTITLKYGTLWYIKVWGGRPALECRVFITLKNQAIWDAERGKRRFKMANMTNLKAWPAISIFLVMLFSCRKTKRKVEVLWCIYLTKENQLLLHRLCCAYFSVMRAWASLLVLSRYERLRIRFSSCSISVRDNQ